MYDLDQTGGYTTFAQENAQNPDDSLAFSYIHGKGTNDPGAIWLRAPDRLRYGLSGRDFTVYVSQNKFCLYPAFSKMMLSFLIILFFGLVFNIRRSMPES